MGIANVKSDLDNLKNQSDEETKLPIKLKRVSKDSHREDNESDADSEILIWIDFCHTPHPKLRDTITFSKEADTLVKDEGEESNLKSEEDNDPFLMPDNSQAPKSRANSEKSVNQKKLIINKVSSDFSNTTQGSSGNSLNLKFLVSLSL